MSNDDCLKDKWENSASASPDTNQIILEMFFPWHGTQENNPKQNETTQGGHTFTLKSLMSLSTKKKITSAPRCFLFYQVSSHF